MGKIFLSGRRISIEHEERYLVSVDRERERDSILECWQMVSMLSSGVDIKRGSPIQTLVLHLSTCQLPYPTSNILDSWGPRTELKIIVFHLSPSLKSDPVVVVGQVIFCLNKMISWYAVLTPQWWSEVWHDAGWVDGEIADIIIMIFILWQ